MVLQKNSWSLTDDNYHHFMCQISNEAEDRSCKALMSFNKLISAKYPDYEAYNIFYYGLLSA
jgi:hypothetical protein